MLDENGIKGVPFLNILMPYSPQGNYSIILSFMLMHFKGETVMLDELIWDNLIVYECVQRPKDEPCSLGEWKIPRNEILDV